VCIATVIGPHPARDEAPWGNIPANSITSEKTPRLGYANAAPRWGGPGDKHRRPVWNDKPSGCDDRSPVARGKRPGYDDRSPVRNDPRSGNDDRHPVPRGKRSGCNDHRPISRGTCPMSDDPSRGLGVSPERSVRFRAKITKITKIAKEEPN
jgi:hypothetical protein